MFRMDESQTAWWKLNRKAKNAHFGRMFRSPSLFEDLVKTMTGCNVTWGMTIRMNRLLCDELGGGGFPTPEQVAAVDPACDLNRRCKVGYRAERIHRLAQRFIDGSIDPAWFEHSDRTSGELYKELLKIYGIGDYAASNMLMLLGHYDRVAIDTETYRHWCQMHGIERPKDAKTLHPAIEEYYNRFSPYQFKAYWLELWGDYERRFGLATAWDAATDGPNFTAANLKNL